MNRFLHFVVFVVGLVAVCWIGAGYVDNHHLALAVTILIGLVYLIGALELFRYQNTTAALERTLAKLTEPPESLNTWLATVPTTLRQSVQLRIEGERAGLPGPTLAPYLVGLLVLLGMLGTFLGMVATLRGTGAALQSATDLQAIRASLAAPVMGLGFAFGTSVAGVATSAVLGLLSALCRRERMAAAQKMDIAIATTLRGYSLTHQREERVKLLQRQADILQRQADTLPNVADRLDAMMSALAKQSQTLNDNLLSSQETFHTRTEQAYSRLAQTLEHALKAGVADTAQAATSAIQPAVQATMSSLTQHTQTLHERIAASVQQHLDGTSIRLDATGAAIASTWQQAMLEQRNAGESLAHHFQASLEGFTGNFEQRSAALLDGMATRLDGATNRLSTAWDDALTQQRHINEKLSSENQLALTAAATSFDQHAAALVHNVSESQASLVLKVSDTHDAFAHKVADSTAELARHISEQHAELTRSVGESNTALSRSVSDSSSELARHISEQHVELTRSVGESNTTLSRSVSDSAVTLSHEVGASNSTLIKEVSDAIGTLTREANTSTKDLVSSVSEANAELVRKVSESHGSLANTLGGATAELTRSVSDSTAEMVRNVGNSTAELARNISESNNELTHRLSESAVTLSREVSESNTALVTAVSHTHTDAIGQQGQAHADLRTEFGRQDEVRLTTWMASLDTLATTLRNEWALTSKDTASQQQAICDALAHTAQSISADTQAYARATIAEIEHLVQAASEAPRVAADVVIEVRQKLSDSMARDNSMLEERSRLLETLGSLLDAVNHASTEQRTAVDALVSTSADMLARVGTHFTEKVEAETRKLTGIAAQVTGSAVEVSSLSEAFSIAVTLFSESNDKLLTHLQRIETAMDASATRSDEQLAYYVAQAREVIDLSILSQKQIMENLQQLDLAQTGTQAATP